MGGFQSSEYKPSSDLERRIQKVMRNYQKEGKGQNKDPNKYFTKVQLNFPKFKQAFESLRELYKSIDKNKDNSIDFKEFHAAVTKMGADVKEEDITAIFKGVDLNRDKVLSFKEFLVCMAIGYIVDTIPLSEKNKMFREAFEAAFELFLSYDDNGDGVIQQKKMMDFLHKIGKEQASERIKELDPDGDGYITFIEYLFAFENWVGVEEFEEKKESAAQILVLSTDDSKEPPVSPKTGIKPQSVRFSTDSTQSP